MKDKKLVTKSNELNEARYKLSALEQKLILYVVAEIQPDDKQFKTYKLKIADFAKLLDISIQTLYTDIQIISLDLMKKVLVIPKSQPNPNDDSIFLTHWFSSVEYFPSKGYVEFCFDPKIKPYLLQLKERFVSYNIKNIVQLKSSYSIRLYELLKQYEKIGIRTFELYELRRILGIQKHEYKLYGDFKKRILLPAQKEIPKKTDLNFNFDEIKEGRSVAQIQFNILKKSNKKNKNSKKQNKSKLQNDPTPDSLIKLLPKEQREKKTILNVITKYLGKVDYNYVARNINYANTECNSNYRVFLCKALSSDWGLEIQEDEQAKTTKAMDEAEKRKVNAKTEIENKQKQKQINDYIKANEKELKVQAMKILDNEMLKELKKKTPYRTISVNRCHESNR